MKVSWDFSIYVYLELKCFFLYTTGDGLFNTSNELFTHSNKNLKLILISKFSNFDALIYNKFSLEHAKARDKNIEL